MMSDHLDKERINIYIYLEIILELVLFQRLDLKKRI